MNWNLTVVLALDVVGISAPVSMADRLHNIIGNDNYVVTPIDALTYNIELANVEESRVEYIKDIIHRQLLFHFDPPSDSMIGVEISYD